MRKHLFFLALLLSLLLCGCQQERTYLEAKTLLEAGQNQEAIAAFSTLGDYKDSSHLLALAGKDQEYLDALTLLDQGNYPKAYDAFGRLGDYKDAADYRARFKKIQITEQNWKEYLYIEEVEEPVKNTNGNYVMIRFFYYMKFNEDVEARFYAPYVFHSYKGIAFCNERELVIDPKTGEYEAQQTENCLDYLKSWNVVGLKETDEGFLLNEGVRHVVDYQDNGEPIYIYNLLTGFNFPQLSIDIYLYE